MAKKGKEQNMVLVKPIKVGRMKVTIVGTSALIQHQWSEKAKEQMRLKGSGKKTKDRSTRDPQQEAHDATYFTADGKFGIPVNALKACIIAAAHKDLGVEKTLVRKGLFIECADANGVLPMKCTTPVVREDPVRVGQGSADLRYRPEFEQWECTFGVEYDGALLRPDDVFNLFERGGFGVGLCEMRPEKGKDNGRFTVKRGA